MRLLGKVLPGLLGLAMLPTAASAAVIGGTYYAPQYDYAEFFAATDGRNFQVILAGTTFPGIDPNTVARDLLPLMQAAKPRPALTFTYDAPAERPRPDYRLVLIFDPANNLGSASVCRGDIRLNPPRSGAFYVYAVYCRNEQPLSETTAWTPATGPTDQRVAWLFRELFQVVFPDSAAYRRLNGGGSRR